MGCAGSSQREDRSYFEPSTPNQRCTTCRRMFGATLWRHHCRGCGHAFCDECVAHRASFPIRGITQPVRLCGFCHVLRSIHGAVDDGGGAAAAPPPVHHPEGHRHHAEEHRPWPLRRMDAPENGEGPRRPDSPPRAPGAPAEQEQAAALLQLLALLFALQTSTSSAPPAATAEDLNHASTIGWKPGDGPATCSICLTDISPATDPGSTVRRLRCSHIFHKDCVDTWLTQHHGTCPVCRASVRDGDNGPPEPSRVEELSDDDGGDRIPYHHGAPGRFSPDEHQPPRPPPAHPRRHAP